MISINFRPVRISDPKFLRCLKSHMAPPKGRPKKSKPGQRDSFGGTSNIPRAETRNKIDAQ